jgi:hypothetical protein
MLVSVRDKDGEIVLHDIYVAGHWIGSRRTIAQCIEALRWRDWPSSVIGAPHGEVPDAGGSREHPPVP